MRILQGERKTGPRVLALGTFDGLHLGHRKLLKTAGGIAAAQGVPLQVVTFDRHPLQVIRPENAPGLLTTLPEKLGRINSAGAAEVRLLHFDKKLAALSPEAFLEKLRSMTKICGIAAGWNYTFGLGGAGDAALLRQDGERNGYPVRILKPVLTQEGVAVSSSEIRETLLAGDVRTAEMLLGAPWSLTGRVREGKHLGTSLGFPTANVEVSRLKLLPKYGVYICIAETPQETYPGVVNIGRQPTLPSGRVTVEVHLLEGSPELYGVPMRLILLEYLRSERKFSSAEALKQQISEDRQTAMKRFGMA